MRNGKGSNARARTVSREQYDENFDRIFSAAPPERWGYARYRDAEMWHRAVAPGRASAIAEAFDYYDGEFEPGHEASVAVCRCVPIDPHSLVPDGDDIVETMAQAFHDNYPGLELDDFPDVSEAATRELTELLRDWSRRHVTLDAWTAEDIETVERDDEQG